MLCTVVTLMNDILVKKRSLISRVSLGLIVLSPCRVLLTDNRLLTCVLLRGRFLASRACVTLMLRPIADREWLVLRTIRCTVCVSREQKRRSLPSVWLSPLVSPRKVLRMSASGPTAREFVS